ncbi:nucleotidyltransferase family protein [Congregibacter variabilis]|uniref:Nucleotidyltransferase family protein n=1 Tax=Congregibacter variabilis TaxID=3081200 RepID=A0ABZ0I2H9_9GAMM|nr:nucleotidyltransferase family protein [Congregibacter sp. IMCC43200]
MKRELSSIVELGFPVLLLAAGFARRFGSDKRSVLMYSRNTLLMQSISQYKDLGFDVLVCLSARAQDDVLASMLRAESIACLRCVRAEEGMGATLSEGVAALGDVPGVLVALADMPGLLSQTIMQLVEHADSHRIVYPVYEGRRGHPVLFGRRFLSQLKALSGDVGGSNVLMDNAESCVPLAVDDAGAVLDVDTPGDLQRVQRLLQERASDGESG